MYSKKMNSSILSGAFTLVELLITVGIVTILCALLFSGFKTVQKSARSATCMNNLRTLYSAALAYSLDHENAIVPCLGYTGAGVGRTFESYLRYDDLGPYIPEEWSLEKACPDKAKGILYSYGANYNLSNIYGNGPYLATRMVNLSNPSKRIFFIDCDNYAAFYPGGDPGFSTPPNRHNGANNMVFLDGHGESRKGASLPKPPILSPGDSSDAARNVVYRQKDNVAPW